MYGRTMPPRMPSKTSSASVFRIRKAGSFSRTCQAIYYPKMPQERGGKDLDRGEDSLKAFQYACQKYLKQKWRRYLNHGASPKHCLSEQVPWNEGVSFVNRYNDKWQRRWGNGYLRSTANWLWYLAVASKWLLYYVAGLLPTFFFPDRVTRFAVM